MLVLGVRGLEKGELEWVIKVCIGEGEVPFEMKWFSSLRCCQREQLTRRR